MKNNNPLFKNSMPYKSIKYLPYLFLLSVCTFTIQAQVTIPMLDSIKLPPPKKLFIPDSTGTDSKFGNLESFTTDNLKKNNEVYNTLKTGKEQNHLFELLNTEIQTANLALKKGIDYKQYAEELNYVKILEQNAIDGVIKNQAAFQTLRNLSLTSVMLHEILLRTDKQLKLIKENYTEFSTVQTRIDSLMTKESLFLIPEDEVSKTLYIERFEQINTDAELINSRFKNALDSINHLTIQGNKFRFILQSDMIEIDKIRDHELDNLFQPEEAIFSQPKEGPSFSDTFLYSFGKEMILLIFYVFNHYGLFILMFLSLIGMLIYLNILKKNLINSNLYENLRHPIAIFNNPVATSFIIVFCVFQYFFTLAPFILLSSLWFISGIFLTRIYAGSLPRPEFRIWLLYFIMISVALLINNIVVHSVTETWMILILSIIAFSFSLYIILKGKQILPKQLINMLILVAIFEFIAIVLLLAGNYNLGKSFMTNGLFTVWVGYMLYNAYWFLYDIRKYTKYVNLHIEEKDISQNFKEREEVPVFIYIFFVLSWVYLIFRNTHLFQKWTNPLREYFSETKMLGDITYSYESIFLFFSTIVLATVLAKIVAFVTSETSTSATGAKTNKLGSWLLLVRIAIISSGIIIAFIIAGLPVDRLTMIISALGVGIGFGLQTVVNNIVSGVIIAFEKPVNLDDIVEVGGQTGTMKSIGLRSSVISTFQGSDVIVPNGDLLNQHLTNWTLGREKCRTEIEVGVAYGTDLRTVKSLLHNILSAHSDVLNNPEPLIQLTRFNDNSIDFVIKFWVAHFLHLNEVKSDLILAIDEGFKAHGIVIPFPQRDIHVINHGEDKNQKSGIIKK